MMGEHGVLMIGEHGVLRMSENGVLMMGEHGVLMVVNTTPVCIATIGTPTQQSDPHPTTFSFSTPLTSPSFFFFSPVLTPNHIPFVS